LARQWPSVNKKTHPLRKDDNLLFVTVATSMYCGEYINETGECLRRREFSTKDALHDRVDSIAKNHIKTCEECKKHYG
jgi:predicted secreted protein